MVRKFIEIKILALPMQTCLCSTLECLPVAGLLISAESKQKDWAKKYAVGTKKWFEQWLFQIIPIYDNRLKGPGAPASLCMFHCIPEKNSSTTVNCDHLFCSCCCRRNTSFGYLRRSFFPCSWFTTTVNYRNIFMVQISLWHMFENEVQHVEWLQMLIITHKREKNSSLVFMSKR